jgi:hypothetical protein
MTPEEALAHCLEEIETGRKTIAESAAQFPDLPELEDQIRAAQSLRALRALAPRPEAARRVEARLRLEAQARRAARPALTLRWAAAIVLVAILSLGAGATASSANSLPGDALYPVKRSIEAAQLIFTPPAGRAAFHAALAHRRLDELAALTERQNADAELITRLTHEITVETREALAAVNAAPPRQQAEVLETILRETGEQQAVLQAVQESAPPEAQDDVARALEASSESQTLAVERREGMPPEEPSATPTPASQSALNSPTPPPPTSTAAVAATQTVGAPGPTPINPPSATAAPPGTAAPTDVPLSPAPLPASSSTPVAAAPGDSPPGQAKKTETPFAPTATQSAPGGNHSGDPAHGNTQDGPSGGPNCASHNANSPNYCTPTPASGATSSAPSAALTPTFTATPTPCPTNASGKPKCRP